MKHVSEYWPSIAVDVSRVTQTGDWYEIARPQDLRPEGSEVHHGEE